MRRRRLGGIGIGVFMLVLAALGPASTASAKTGPTVTAQPSATLETDAGTVSYTVSGSGFPPGLQLLVHSTACGGSPTLVLGSDLGGQWSVTFSQVGCFPGSYLVSASENSPPGHTFVTHITIIPPAGHGPVTFLVNPNPVRISNSSFISFTINLFGLPPGMGATINYGGLCLASGPVALPPADLNGHINLSFEKGNCVPGNYHIAVIETSAPFRQFSKLVVLTAP